ncbi:MAG: sigma-70 family RNA polymerase sigma factor [Elusimicrobia bacterium]|nr:sigma-70 family RNA polymerase sigma factor [Elusimicrobiota bacterium]
MRAGRRELFAELVRRYQDRILGLCASILSDRSQAEDAAQEIFIKAFRALDDFRGGAAFATWLYRVASNHCLDLLRKKSRQKTDSLEMLAEREGERFEKLFAAPDPAGSLLERSDLVERALSRLPPDYRLILTLRESQGLNYREIAQVLNCSLDAVKARLRRARKELEGNLRHFLGSENV